MAEPSSPTSKAASAQYQLITDGQADIAMTNDMDQMKVELVGRQPLQHVWLWTGSNEESDSKKKSSPSTSQLTNKSYNPETDGPAVAGLPDATPSEEQCTPHEAAVEYLEVGLVIGGDPKKMKQAVKGTAKEVRATLARDPTALRAFLHVNAYVAEQAKYYVGCKQTRGRCFPRVIDCGLVFFYAEFWHGLPEKMNKKQRRAFVNSRTKYHAAINKPAADRSTAAINSTEAEERATPTPLTVAQSESAASTLELQDAASDLNDGPYTAIPGLVAFHDFEEELSVDDAENLKRELKVAIPGMPDLGVVQIRTVHQILRSNGWGDRLAYSGIPLFFEFCHERVSKALMGFDIEVIKREVENALQKTRRHNKY